MSRKELYKAYGLAGALWSNFKLPEGELEARLFDETWFLCLQRFSFDIVLTAMHKFAQESDFCNIAKIELICEKLLQIQEGTFVDEEEIYREIRKAIVAPDKKQAFERLSDVAKDIVMGEWQLFKWGMLDSNVVESVVMSSVRKRASVAKEHKHLEDSLKRIQLVCADTKLLN